MLEEQVKDRPPSTGDPTQAAPRQASLASAQTLIEDFSYRPEIDGLRAIAVVSVILFHAQLALPGGYVGVDVFFVISGFLITSLILRDAEQNRFTLAQFWERRARRILPAVTVVALATLAAGWFLLIPVDYAATAESAAHQAVFLANLYFRDTIGYFNDATELMPLLHTWSLAVEEQFYMLFPLILFVLFRYPSCRRRGVLLALFACGTAISLWLSCQALANRPKDAFYFPHTRAWELLLGCSVAIFPAAWIPARRLLRELGSCLGLAAILIPCVLYEQDTPFPGLAAVPPCLGAALIVWATAPIGAPQPTLGRLLASRPLVFVGLVSYSLYLWHWPLLAFARYWSFEPLSVEYRIGLIAASFALSVLSWRYVEIPFRKRSCCASRRAIFVATGAGLAAVLGSGLLVVLAKGFPDRLPPQARAYADAKNDRPGAKPLDTEDRFAKNLHAIGIPDVPPKVLVWGDSHASSVLPAFDAFLREKGMAGQAAMRATTPPVLGFVGRRRRDVREGSTTFNDDVFAYAQKQRFSDVVLVARWKAYGALLSPDGRGTDIRSQLLLTVQRLAQEGIRPWVFLQVPEHEVDVPIALTKSVLSGEDISRFCSKPGWWNGLFDEDNALLPAIETAGGRWLDPRPFFLDAGGQYYRVSADGFALYYDKHHLTTKGAMLTILPLLRESFSIAPSETDQRPVNQE
jgi:peptidoglycan/LPS O-acetylase OafA/YrhL